MATLTTHQGHGLRTAARSSGPLHRVDCVGLPAVSTAPRRILFLYWGRRGLSEFVLQLAKTAHAWPNVHAIFSVSRQNERFADFACLGASIEPIVTFGSNFGALLSGWRIRRLRTQLLACIRRNRIDTVISLMPHVWGPFIAPAIRAEGIKFISLIHDAAPHPGDLASLVASWALRDAQQNSDLVLTLSEHVAHSLAVSRAVEPSLIRTLFHPDLCFSAMDRPLPRSSAGSPFRVLFLGRILPYKGLDLLIEAVEALRESGVAIELGVFGEGALGGSAKRLKAMGAEVVNRWLATDEISAALARYHAVILSYTEASQSGIAALAAGHGVPVIANPVGGLVEQVVHGRGILARSPDASALAEAIGELAGDCKLYNRILAALAESRERRSMRAFLSAILACIPDVREAELAFDVG